MAINFPNSPSVNDIHSEGGVRWKWNGSSWTRASSGPAITDTITTSNDNSTTTLYPVMVTGTGSNGAKVATSATKSISFDASDGNLTVAGNISVGGTLTYEDVKNVDSVGVGTFRSGAHFGPSTGVGATISSEGDITAGIITATFVGDGSGLTGVANTDYVHAHTLSVVGVTTLTTLNVNSQVGAAGSVLSSTGSGLNWVSPQTGPQGAQGVQGAAGAAGAQGAQGHQGLTGAAGAQGHQGRQGAAGAQGAQGHQGVQGAQGHQGVQGAGGAAGAQGNQGVQGATNNLTVSTSPPGSPSAGDMWWDSDDGRLGVYYNDGNSSQWVNINNGPAGAQGAQGRQGAQGATGAQGSVGIASLTISTGAPSSPNAGDMWWDSDDGDLHLYFNDGNSSQWVNINAGSAGAQGVQGAAGAQGAQGAAGTNASVANPGNDRVVTSVSGTNLNAEANMQFDGTDLFIPNLIKHLGDPNNHIGFPGADTQTFTTGGTERLRITSGGRLGLGVTPKSWHSNNKGVIQGNGGYSILGRSDNFLGIYQNFYYDGSDAGKYIANGEASAYFQNDGSHRFYTAVSGSADASSSLQERLRIANDGNVTVKSEDLVFETTGKGIEFPNSVSIKQNVSNLYANVAAGNNNIEFQSNGTSFVKFRGTNGDVEIVDGDLVISTAGHGINFAANTDGGGTSSATVLEDYEEGTYSTTMVSSNCTLDNSSGTGYYIKVGNMVHVRGTFSLNTSDGSPAVSGSDAITQALPYTRASNGTFTGTMLQQNINWGGPTSLAHPHYFNPVVADYVCQVASDGIRFYMNRIEYAYQRLNNSHLHVGYPGYTSILWNITYQTT